MLLAYRRNKTLLKRSKFRSSFVLDEKDFSYISEKGIDTVKQHALEFIRQRLADAQPYRDGKQTPYSGHPVFKAQHAIGACCRGCLEKWYKIPKGIALNEKQINDVVEVIMEWIKEQHTKTLISFC
jgi:exodeoxyribonuclease V alpha subunit